MSLKIGFTLFTLALLTEAQERVEKNSIDFGRVREVWNDCCHSRNKVCYGDSCYFLEQDLASWDVSRNKCRSRYPAWPMLVDLVSLDDRQEEQAIRNLTKKINDRRPRDFRKGVWTGGNRCPTKNSSGKMVLKNSWISGWDFPKWLENMFPSETEISTATDRCQFLALFVDNQNTITYNFKEMKKTHPGVCQFRNALPAMTSTTSNPTTVSNTKNTRTPSTKRITAEDTTSSFESSTKEKITQSTEYSSTEHKSTHEITSSTENYTPSTSSPAVTSVESTPSSTTDQETWNGCKGREAGGIFWPNTEPGETVQMDCPDGMSGNADWTCDAETHNFVPFKPRIQRCRHEWIDSMQEEVNEGYRDAVELSQQLATKTKQTNFSHGDLPALVNLTDTLVKLFTSQQKGISNTHKPHEPSFRFTSCMVTSFSHILRRDVRRAWNDLDKSEQQRAASWIIRIISETGHRLSCAVYQSQDLQYSVTDENINLQTFHMDPDERQGRPYVFPKGLPSNISRNILSLPGELNLKHWSSTHCNKRVKTAVGILYNNIGQFLEANDETVNSSPLVVSPVISFSLDNATNSIRLPEGYVVSIELQRLAEDDQGKTPRCVFWNFRLGKFGDWDSDGCKTLWSNATHTACSCNHLTNFAVIMDVNNNIKADDDRLEALTYICCGVSTISLLATCVCLLTIKAMRCRRSTITCNLSFCLLIVNVLILFGFNQTKYKVLCAVVAGMAQFFLLAAFCWMLLEGFHLYQMVVMVFYHSTHFPISYFYGFGYGIPLIIVCIAAALARNDYGRPDVCWLSNEHGLMWSLVGPIALICCINLAIFVRTMLSASSAKIKKEQTTANNVKALMKGSFSILCLLGLTWLIGFLYMIQGLYFTAYIFIVLNGLQGVSIFIFHVLLNEKATSGLLKKFQTKIKRSGLNTKSTTITTSSQQRTKRSLTSSFTTANTRERGDGQSPTTTRRFSQETTGNALFVKNAAVTRMAMGNRPLNARVLTERRRSSDGTIDT